MFRVYDSTNKHLGKLSNADDALLVAGEHKGSTIKVGARKARVVVWKDGDPNDPEMLASRATAALPTGEAMR